MPCRTCFSLKLVLSIRKNVFLHITWCIASEVGVRFLFSVLERFLFYNDSFTKGGYVYMRSSLIQTRQDTILEPILFRMWLNRLNILFFFFSQISSCSLVWRNLSEAKFRTELGLPYSILSVRSFLYCLHLLLFAKLRQMVHCPRLDTSPHSPYYLRLGRYQVW